MLKRIVGLVVGTTVACSAFAASAATVTSTSTYDANDATKVTVANRVADVREGNTLTYLAWEKNVNLDALKGENIVYIDQVTLASTDLKTVDEVSVYDFSYTADATKSIEASVKVGGDITAELASIDGPSCAVSINGGNAVAVEYTNDTDLVPVAFADAHLVTALSIGEEELFIGTDWMPGVGTIAIKGSYLKTNELALTATIDNVTPVDTDTIGIAYLKDGSIVVVGQSFGNAEEFGVMLSLGDDTFLPYAALSRGTDGMFAVKFTGMAGSVAEGTKVSAKAYYKTGEEYTASNVAYVEFGGTEDVAGKIIR